MLWKKSKLIFLIILFNSSIIGLIFPDFDYYYIKTTFFKEFIGHRSILTHSIIIPSFVWFLISEKIKINKNFVLIVIGLFFGLSLHLAADFFPKNVGEGELIKLPGNISIGKFSQLWIALNFFAGLFIVKKLLNKFFKEKYYKTYFLICSTILTFIYIFLESDNQILILITFLISLFVIILFDNNYFKIKKIKINRN